MLKEFRDFISRGNIIDLAVAVILGIAFGVVVNAFTDGVLMALIAAIVGKPDFSSLTFRIGDGVIQYGAFLTAVVNFLIVAFALFMVLKAVSKANAKKDTSEPAETAPAPSDETLLLTDIRDLLATQAAPAKKR